MSRALRVLVWQWGRRGAGPRFAAELAAGFAALPDVVALLSLSRQAELLTTEPAPRCDLPIDTYAGTAGFLWRLVTLPLRVPGLVRKLRAVRPDVAICAMPGPIDQLMASALRRLGVPFLVMVHDASSHPGDWLPAQRSLQRSLIRQSSGVVALSGHVAAQLRDSLQLGGRPLIMASHPPFAFGPKPPPPRSHGGPLRLLFFGRLLPYKGLGLFADALRRLGPRADIEVRIAGLGPDSGELTALRALPGVVVENRWVPEAEMADLLAWADALVLSHLEATQSGVAAVAVAARRWLVATDVGGLAEQLRREPLARLCAPDAAELARAIESLIIDPPRDTDPPSDPGDAWRDMARGLADDIRVTLKR
jgi:glycosyltransferase involved in cell wall biosynthesis